MLGFISELGDLARKIMISNHLTQFENSFLAYLSETKVQNLSHQIKICVSSFFFETIGYFYIYGKVKLGLKYQKKKKKKYILVYESTSLIILLTGKLALLVLGRYFGLRFGTCILL